jgi:hypothetical protein
MIRSFKILYFLFFPLLFACQPKVVEVLDKQKLPKKKEKELIAVLDSLSEVIPKTFYSKLNVDFKDTTRSISFKTSLKIVTDSATNALITYLKIPIVSAMITKDSVIVVNKRDKCFQKENLGFIKENFGVDFNYQNVEELLLGRPLDFSEGQKYFMDNNPYFYGISTHKKRERKRLDRKPKEDVIINYVLTDNAKLLQSMSIDSPSDSTVIEVEYQKWQFIQNINVPEEVKIKIKTPKNQLLIQLRYDKAEINEPQELIIVIPEKYEKCN